MNNKKKKDSQDLLTNPLIANEDKWSDDDKNAKKDSDAIEFIKQMTISKNAEKRRSKSINNE